MHSERFIKYYVNQTGHGSLPGFIGAPVMYGRGLGAMLSRAFRFVLPFLKQGVDLAKPHLKSAAKGIASELIGAVGSRIGKEIIADKGQEGSGLPRISSKKRKRTVRLFPQELTKKRRQTSTKKQRKFKSQLGSRDIF